jgi:hypothetical protein
MPFGVGATLAGEPKLGPPCPTAVPKVGSFRGLNLTSAEGSDGSGLELEMEFGEVRIRS